MTFKYSTTAYDTWSITTKIKTNKTLWNSRINLWNNCEIDKMNLLIRFTTLTRAQCPSNFNLSWMSTWSRSAWNQERLTKKGAWSFGKKEAERWRNDKSKRSLNKLSKTLKPSKWKSIHQTLISFTWQRWKESTMIRYRSIWIDWRSKSLCRARFARNWNLKTARAGCLPGSTWLQNTVAITVIINWGNCTRSMWAHQQISIQCCDRIVHSFSAKDLSLMLVDKEDKGLKNMVALD